jgi:cephalosporin hydroxylase
LDEVELEAIRKAYRDPLIAPFRLLLHEGTKGVLDKILYDPSFPGATDPSALSLLATYLRVRQPARVLELGTYVGFSTLVLADVLAGNPTPAQLTTVEPSPIAMEKAKGFVANAGLASAVHFVLGKSIDPTVLEQLRDRGPFDTIYTDSSHSYRETLEELNTFCLDPRLSGVSTSFWFHDAGPQAADYDALHEGGVRRALDEWRAARGADFQILVLEPPFWPNPTGLAVMCRRVGEKPRERVES